MTLRNSIGLGILGLTAVTAVVCAVAGREAVLSGIAGGLTIATVGLFLFVRSYPSDTSAGLSRMVTRHLAGALLFRIPVMVGVFVAAILLLRINSFGILIGTTVGAAVFGITAFTRYLNIDKQGATR